MKWYRKGPRMCWFLFGLINQKFKIILLNSDWSLLLFDLFLNTKSSILVGKGDMQKLPSKLVIVEHAENRYCLLNWLKLSEHVGNWLFVIAIIHVYVLLLLDLYFGIELTRILRVFITISEQIPKSFQFDIRIKVLEVQGSGRRWHFLYLWILVRAEPVPFFKRLLVVNFTQVFVRSTNLDIFHSWKLDVKLVAIKLNLVQVVKGKGGLVCILKFKSCDWSIPVEDFDCGHVSIVAEKVEQPHYKPLIVLFDGGQIWHHEHFRGFGWLLEAKLVIFLVVEADNGGWCWLYFRWGLDWKNLHVLFLD